MSFFPSQHENHFTAVRKLQVEVDLQSLSNDLSEECLLQSMPQKSAVNSGYRPWPWASEKWDDVMGSTPTISGWAKHS